MSTNNNTLNIEINLTEYKEDIIQIQGYIKDFDNNTVSNKLIKLVESNYNNGKIKDKIIDSSLSDVNGFYSFEKKCTENSPSLKITL